MEKYSNENHQTKVHFLTLHMLTWVFSFHKNCMTLWTNYIAKKDWSDNISQSFVPGLPILGTKLLGKKIYQQNWSVTDHIKQFHYLQWEKIITFRSNNQKMKSQIKEWTYYQQDYWYSETQICAYLRSKSSSRLSVHLKHYIYLAKQTVLLSFNNKLIEASLWDNLGKVSLYIYIRLEVY